MSADPDDLRQALNQRTPDEAKYSKAQHYSEASIKQGTWLTTPLWNEEGWKEVIERHDGSWQDFMRAFSLAQYDFVRWGRRRKQWEDAMSELVDEVVEEVFQN